LIDHSYLQFLVNNPEEISKIDFERLLELLEEAKEAFSKESLLIELQTKSKDDKLIIIGDIHGNFNAFLTLLKIIREQDPKYVIFLGDIVDRGKNQLECLVVVLALKILNPESYFLLRGNHETIEMNKAYGFYQDYLHQFDDAKSFYEIVRVYDRLPFCLTINDDILCLHGGIPENSHILQLLKGLSQEDVDEVVLQDIEEDLLQIMWNDPKEIQGFRPSFRGPGVFDYGEDIFKEFMAKNDLTYLIRAHECFPEGYRWFFNKRLLSIFSAPDYRKGAYRNPGSYALIKNGKIIPKLFE